MGRRYENQDASGRKVWLQDKMEVHEDGGGRYRVCWNPARQGSEDGWVPGSFATVDEAFQAGLGVRQYLGKKASG